MCEESNNDTDGGDVGAAPTPKPKHWREEALERQGFTHSSSSVRDRTWPKWKQWACILAVGLANISMWTGIQ